MCSGCSSTSGTATEVRSEERKKRKGERKKMTVAPMKEKWSFYASSHLGMISLFDVVCSIY